MVSLKTLVLENGLLKLTAVLLAFLMWLGVSGQQFEEIIIPNVTLEFRNKPESLEIVGLSSKVFEVQLRTPRRLTVLDKDLAVVVDLSNAQEGSPVFPLDPKSYVRVPDGAEAIRVNPSRLVVTLERTASKFVAIEPKFEGQVADDYEIVGVATEPSGVMISGPRSRVEPVQVVTTEAINLTMRRSPFVTAVNLIGERADVRIDHLDPVRVSIEIQEKRRTVQVAAIPVDVQNAPGRFRLRTSQVTARVRVPVSFTGDLKADSFSAVVDVDGLAITSADHEVTPRLVVKNPEEFSFDVEVVSIRPATVRIRLLSPS